jgi:RNA polymerase sigma factor (sigma-70 family)
MAQKQPASGRNKEASKRPSVPPDAEADSMSESSSGKMRTFEDVFYSDDREVFAQCRIVTGSSDEAHDLMQHVLLEALKSQNTLKEGSFDTWLTTATRNMIEHYRRTHLQKISDEPGSKIESTEIPFLEKVLEIQDREEVINRAVEVIGDEEQAMRWLGTPVRALDYATPISRLHDSEGQAQVLRVLSQLEHGVL